MIDEKKDNYQFSGKYHIHNNSNRIIPAARVSLTTGYPPRNEIRQTKSKLSSKMKVKRKRSSSGGYGTPSQNESCTQARAFHIDELVDIHPGVVSIPFANGLIEPINKHYLVSFFSVVPQHPVIDSYQHSRSNMDVIGKQVIEIQNLEAHGLGIRLPPGDVRIMHVSQPASSIEVESLETVSIRCTEKSEVITICLKEICNLTGIRTPVKFSKDERKRIITEDISLSITNKACFTMTTVIEDSLTRWKNWKITQTSSEFHPNGKDKARWVLSIPPNTTETITYTVQYSWE